MMASIDIHQVLCISDPWVAAVNGHSEGLHSPVLEMSKNESMRIDVIKFR